MRIVKSRLPDGFMVGAETRGLRQDLLVIHPLPLDDVRARARPPPARHASIDAPLHDLARRVPSRVLSSLNTRSRVPRRNLFRCVFVRAVPLMSQRRTTAPGLRGGYARRHATSSLTSSCCRWRRPSPPSVRPRRPRASRRRQARGSAGAQQRGGNGIGGRRGSADAQQQADEADQ